MGKDRSRKRHRTTPLDGKDSEIIETEILTDTSQTTSELLAKLQSATANDRASAAVVIANFAADPSTRMIVANTNIIRAAAPLILDSSVHVRHCISGCLRDISSWGEDSCELLMNSDIMTPLGVFLQSVRTYDWQKLEQSQSAILIDILAVLAALCESVEVAVEIFNRENLVELLYPLISMETTRSSRVSLSIAQCLLAVTENNAHLSQKLQSEHDTLLRIIQSPMDSPDYLLLKTMAAGILFNLQTANDNFPLIVSTIKASLGRHLTQPMTTTMEKIQTILDIQKKRDLDVENMEDLERDVQISVDDLSNILHAKKTALELLANLCCDDEEEEWEDLDEDMSSTSEMDTEESLERASRPELLETLAAAQLLSLIIEHVDALDGGLAAVFKSFKASRHLPGEIHDIRCRGLLCIDNMAQSSNVESMGGFAALQSIFKKLLQLLFDLNKVKWNESQRTIELIEATSSACRSLLDCLARSECRVEEGFVTNDDMAALCAVALENENASVKLNVAKCTAFLATLLRGNNLLVKGTTEFLLQMAAHESDLRVCSEAVDSLMDVFGEDDTDGIAAETGLVTELKKLAPRFKAMMKAAPKGENKMIAQTCNLNLERFIKYKGKRLTT